MKYIRSIELPEHKGNGGFDHAAVNWKAGLLYVAHTANDAIDLIDCLTDRYVDSIPGFAGVAGALVAEELGYVFTSNRGEDTVGIIDPHSLENIVKVKVGVRPNGLSVDPKRGLLLAANVGDPDVPGSHTVSIVDIERRKMLYAVPVPGRTRWTIFDQSTDCFYVNIASPAQIVVIQGANTSRVQRFMDVPAEGPHGLELDPATGRLFCACDAGQLFALEAATGKVLARSELSGPPDVIFFNPGCKHLYVAVGEPGVLDVFETDGLQRVKTIMTERGAHTIGLDAKRNKVYVFEPGSHQAAVYMDE